VLVRYKPGVVPPLAYKGADLRITAPSWDDMVAPFAGYLLGIFGIGVVATLVMTVPIRRLERGLKKLKENKWRGQLDSEKIDAPAGLASAVEAINEMAGQLAQLDARSQEREALLATLAQSLEEGMLVLDASGEVAVSNPAARRILTGAPGNPSRGMGGNGEIPQQVLHDIMTASLAVSSGLEIDRGDGTSVQVQLSKIPFEVRPGESGTLVLLRDVAILHKVQSHLLEAGRFSTLAHLAGALAHEIRNPLNAIGLNAAAIQQVLEQPAFSEAASAHSNLVPEAASTIIEETRRLKDLLNTYLALLRSEPEIAKVDVRDLCRKVVQLLRYPALNSGVELRLEGDEDLPPIEGVPDRIQQAVLNLALNAVQATPRGGTVTLMTRAMDGYIRLEVSDTGPGVPPDLAPRLFEAKVSTKVGDAGLGLPLVRMIAEAHGGRVSFRPGVEGGSVFMLRLPEKQS
jgi:signal transduction histidine kinase